MKKKKLKITSANVWSPKPIGKSLKYFPNLLKRAEISNNLWKG